jgi:dihydrofolate synthase/folylpolyglutamate synthase
MTTAGSRAEQILAGLERFGMRLGLDTVKRVLASLGDPHRRLTTVLVAGTNGKGSVSALIAAMATAAGYRAGLFTSPHLESVCERLKIDGRPIEIERLGELLQTVDAHSREATGGPATYFESIFMAACTWFLREQTDVVVLEVGLGGRLDATNVSDPILSVITEVALEHRTQLGDTVEQVAREKAGILRRDRPVIVGVEDPAALLQLHRLALETGAHWTRADELVRTLRSEENSDWSRQIRLRSERNEYDIHLRLAGGHQERNLVTSVAAIETLRDAGWERLDRAAVETGVSTCTWPGRLERISIPDRADVVLDAAHNPQAARALAEFLDGRLSEYALVFGVLDDKEVGGMLPAVSRAAGEVVLTRPSSNRARDPKSIDHLSRCEETIVLEGPGEAIGYALASGRPVVVCGSIYLVGEIRGLLRERFGVPPPA